MHLPALTARRVARPGVVLATLGYLGYAVQGRVRDRIRVANAQLVRAKAEAERHTRLLQAILDSTKDGIAVVDQDGRSMLQNPAAKAILGALDDSGTAKWEAHYGIFHPETETRFTDDEQPLVRALAGEPSDQLEMLIRNAANPSGKIISVCAQPLRYSDQQAGAVAVFHDVTSLREHEAELAAFAGVVAHDLKAPLTAITGYSEIILDDIEGLPEAAIPLLERIMATGGRMQQLIDDLLGYASARDKVLNPSQLDLRPMVNDIIAERFAAARLTTDLPAPQANVGPLEVVHADPVMIRQLLNNLISNALKYTPPGRPAELDLSTTPAEPGWVRVEVADRGIGIPQSEQRAIFDDFHRVHTRNEYAGTGLGLAICDRIITRHGGRIGVQDNPGGGSRFWFTLPSAETEIPEGGHPRAADSVSR